VKKSRTQASARYGIEISGVTSHAEANELNQVLTELDGHNGKVRVIDRVSQIVVFDGPVHEVRESISAFFLHQRERADGLTTESSA